MNKNTKFTIPTKIITSANQPRFFPKSRAFILVFTILALTVLVANTFIWKPLLEVDNVSYKNIYANSDFSYKDIKSTQKLIEDAIDNVKPSLKKDKEIAGEQLSVLTDYFQTIIDVKQVTTEDPYYSKSEISTDVQKYLFSLSQTQWEKNICVPVLETLAQLMAGGIPRDASTGTMQHAIRELIPPGTTKIEDKAITQILMGVFYPKTAKAYYSLMEDTSSAKAKKKEFEDLYANFLTLKIDNEKWLKTDVYIPEVGLVTTYLGRTVFILRRLELIRSVKTLNRLAYMVLPEPIRDDAKLIKEDKLWEAKEVAVNTLTQMFEEGLTQVEIDNSDEEIQKYLPGNLNVSQKNLIYFLLKRSLKPNVYIDQKQLEVLKKEVRKTVKPVYVNVERGTLLLERGQLITEDKLHVLEAAGLLDKRIDWNGVTEVFTIVTLIVFLFVLYLYLFERDIFVSSTYLWLISINILIVTLVSEFISTSAPQFMPLAIMAGILAMFASKRLALVTLLYTFLLYFKALDLDYTTIITLFMGSIAAVLIFPKLTQRINILKSGIVIALMQVIVYNITTFVFDMQQSLDLISKGDNNVFLFDSVLWFASGIAFTMVILGILPVVEEFFGLVTYSRLTELGDFNQPLLRELEEKAPGTFQHSIAVSSLTEFTSRKLNLDSTFCRVGAYYHDIGKMIKPEFFIENQHEEVNPHDILNDPLESAKIIISHTRAGVILAEKHKLPQALRPFITEHHGDGLVAFFFYKAKQQAKNPDDIDAKHFRYFGPKPQSKETALTMLADCTEAAVRTVRYKNRESISTKIRDIVSEKINDGQLSESGLTTDEIAVIIESFTNVMLEIYHKRIEYPDSKE